MVEQGRTGKKDGKGFYDYTDGKRDLIWPEVREHFKSGSKEIPLEDMKERMLFAEALETVKCFDGVLTSVEDANIGSIFGIGFPPGPVVSSSTSTSTRVACRASSTAPTIWRRSTVRTSPRRPRSSRRPLAVRSSPTRP